MPDAVAAATAPVVAADPAAVAAPVTGTAASPSSVVAADVAAKGADTSAPKFKVKVDGKEMEVTQEELVKGYQLESVARKRTQEATEFLNAFEKDPRGAVERVLKEKGKTSLKDLAIQVLSEEHQAMLEDERRKSLDPAQRETEDKLRELDGLKAEKKKQDEAAHAQRVGVAKQQLSKAVIDTMQEFPESVRRNEALAQNVFEAWAFCVQHPDEAKELGIDATPKGIATALRKRQYQLAQAMIASAGDDDLPDLVSEAIAAKILAKKKAAVEKAAHPSLTSSPQVRGAEKKDGPPRKSQGAKLRELTLGSLGIK